MGFWERNRKSGGYLLQKKTKEIAVRIIRAILLFGMCFLILQPILTKISVSFMEEQDLYNAMVINIPEHFTTANYKLCAKFMDYAKSLLNTSIVSLSIAVLQITVCTLVGYGFARFEFPLKKFWFACVIMVIIIPPQTISTSLHLHFRYFDIFGLFNALMGDSINLVDTNLSMYIPALMCNGIRAGLFIYLFRQFFRGLPKELEDAAYLDGCGPFKTFISVMVPNAASSFLTVFIFSIVWYWNDYYVSSMYFTKANTISLKIDGIANIISMYLTGEVGVASDYIVWMEAACLLAITPIVIMYIFLQKYFTEGIARAGLAN